MLYKYIGADSSDEYIDLLEKIVGHGTIKASMPSTFNDPSEFKVRYTFDAEDHVKRKSFVEHTRKENPDEYLVWLESFSDDKIKRINEETRFELLNRCGVICFTRNPENYLMWSHYAKSHTGICIGFDISILNSIDNDAINQPVKYSEDVPEFNFFHQSQADFGSATFFHKSKYWDYEEEIRVVTEKHGIKDFNTELVQEIIIGCEASIELELHAKTYASQNVSVFKMHNDPHSYKLKKEKIS